MFPVVGYEDEKYSRWSCRQRMDRLETWRSTREGLEARLQVFVHPDLPLEVWRVTLVNRRKVAARPGVVPARPRQRGHASRSTTSCRAWCARASIEDGAMVFVNHDKGNKHPRTAFLASAEPMDGYDMMNEVFEGGPGRAPIPAAVARGACFNTLGLQPYAGLIAAAQFNAHLDAGRRAHVDGRLRLGAQRPGRAARVARSASARRSSADSGQVLAALGEGWTTKVLRRRHRDAGPADRPILQRLVEVSAPQPVAVHRGAGQGRVSATSSRTCWRSATSSPSYVRAGARSTA